MQKLPAKNKKKDLIKNQFIENIIHDLRVPCAGIINAVSILEKLETIPHKIELLNNICGSANVLLDILQSISDFGYISSKKLAVINSTFDLVQLIKNLVQSLSLSTQQKKLSLLVTVDKNIPPLLIGDQYRLTRIMLNLIGNSIKFTQKGKIKITAKLIKQNNNKAIISLIINDTGIGIPKNMQQTIFKRCVQLNQTDGSGLGLAIVKQFIEDINGRIKVSSILNKGTTFTCTIPFKISDAPAKSLLEDRQLKILLIEDDPVSQKITKTIIENEFTNLPIHTAFFGSEALKLITKNDYDIIFLDLNLGDIKGLTIAKKIRAIKTTMPLIIVLTAYQNYSVNNSNVDGYLTKPIDIKQAKTMLENLLQQKKPFLKIRKSKIFKPNEHLSPIDIATVKKRLKLTDQNLQSLIAMLINELPQTKKDLKQASIKNNFTKIQQIIHKLQGGASYCGAYRLKDACQKLAFAIEQTKTKKELKILLQKVHFEIDAVVKSHRP